MDVKDPNIRSQDSAYRRGLVLGLTMAEIMVLILFALLLALAAVLASREKIVQTKDKRIAELVILEQQIADLVSNNPEGVTISDIIRRMERQQNQVVALQTEVDRLKSVEAGSKALEDIIREIRRTGSANPTPQQVVEKIQQTQQLIKEGAALQKEIDRLKPFEAGAKELADIIREVRREGDSRVTSQQVVEKLQRAQQLMKDNDNLRGQVTQLTNQIRGGGRGNEFPSCWVTPEGKIESIFELVITANGIGIKDRLLPHRADEKAGLPLGAVRYSAELPLSEFQGQVRPLYQWSVENHCRFYVIISSSVTSAPIQLVNAVNSFFYPDSRIQYRPGAL